MKFPSVKYLTSQAGASFKRFYLPLIFAFIGTYAGLLAITNHSQVLNRILLGCVIGLPLTLGGMLYAERTGRSIIKWLTVLLAIAYWHWLAPDTVFDNRRLTLIFFVLVVVMHLWVAIAPYIHNNEKVGFWRYNETLYVRMLLSLLFSVALFAGVSLAIEACEVLLKLDLGVDIYGRLWIIVMGTFNTWFFLAGIPADYAAINTEKVFPKALKIFTQYILIPLVTLYMLILYAYGIKIIGLWTLPKGWVSTLILSYAVVGILAVLLTNPLRDDKDAPWVRLFSKFFFRAALPLIVLLYTAIWLRVSNYGITESRYYLMIMGGWLGFISLYFIFSSQKNIKVIPFSLFIIGLLSLCGPWGVFAVSRRSQLHRLENILTKNNIWKPGEKVTASKTNLNVYDGDQLVGIIDYFIDEKEVTALQPIYAIDLAALVKETHKRTNSNDQTSWEERNALESKLANILGARHTTEGIVYHTDKEYTADLHAGANIAGFSKVFNIDYTQYRTDNTQWIFITPTDSLEATVTQKDSIAYLSFLRSGKVVENINLNGLVKNLRDRADQDNIPEQGMTIDDTGAIKVRIIIKSILIKDIESTDDKTVKELNAWILMK